MFTEQQFDTGEVRLNYAEGPDAGPPVLLLHGDTGRWEDLAGLASTLAVDHHVFLCDRRGHGKSSWGSSYEVADFARDTVAFVDGVVGGGRLAIVGHSGGSLSAVLAASMLPGRVDTLVVIDPVFFLREESVASNYTGAYFASVHAVLTGERELDRFLDELVGGDQGGRAYIAETFATLDPAVPKTHLDDAFVGATDLGAVLASIDCPTRMIYGEVEHGSLVRERDLEFFVEHVADGDAVRIPDAGHLIHVGQPERLAELTTDWLARTG